MKKIIAVFTRALFILVSILIILVGYLAFISFKSRDTLQPITGTNPPNSAENAPPGSIHNLPVPQAVSGARMTLAARLHISESKILILEAIETNWPDACLGIPEKNSVCAQTITPGFRIVMMANGIEYRYRTNQEGTVIKSEV